MKESANKLRFALFRWQRAERQLERQQVPGQQVQS